MPQCTWGSEKREDAPDWYQYQYTGLSSLVGPIANLATPELLGLPSAPFYVPDFCATEPTGDPFQIPADLLLLGTGAIGIAAGAWGRLGNTVKYNTFTDLCICKADPDPNDDCYSTASYPGPFTNAFTSSTHSMWGTIFYVSRPMNFTGCTVWNYSGATGSREFWLIDWDDKSHLVEMVASIGGAGSVTIVNSAVPRLLEAGHEYAIVYEIFNGEQYKNLIFPGVAGTHHSGALTVTARAYNDTPPWSVGWNSGTAQIPIMPQLCEYVPPPVEPQPYPFVLPPGYPTGPSLDCGTGEDICAKIDSLRSQFGLLLSRVDLIQRQIVPFAYVPGATHSGLTGSGSFAVQGILGLRVSLTSAPNYLGQAGTGSPTLFDVGYITLGTPDGFLRSEPIMKAQYVMLDVSPAVTSVTYDLAPNVVASILELIREP